MKTFKRIVVWSLTAILLQSGAFFIADKYYEKTLLNTKVKEEVVGKQKEVDQNLSIKIPSTAKKTEASFDGKYLSYYDDSKLTVVNSFTGKSTVVAAEANSEQVYSKWLPDINSMVLCERDLGKKTTINIFTYNADNDNKQAPTDTNNHDIKFTITNSKDTIGDIEMSTTMGIMYIKTMKNNWRSDIFNNDVNGKTVSIFTSKNIGNTNVFQHKPNLIYEDTSNNLIKVTNTSWSIGKLKACLFNTDTEDNIYIGALSNGKVQKIMYGSMDQSIDKWKSLSLQTPVDKKNIIVTKNGAIYLHNSLEGYVTNEISMKKTSYTGNLLRITDAKIISIENGIIKKTDLP